MITKEITIEDLVDSFPFSVRYLMEKKIRCIMCGEPRWGTLEDAAKEKGYDEGSIEEFIKDLNDLAKKHN